MQTRDNPGSVVQSNVAIWLLRLLIGIYTRLTDLALLLVRPHLIGPYCQMWWAGLRRPPDRKGFEAVRAAKASAHAPSELLYGEAPVGTALRLLRLAGVTADSHVVDLGAGRGRALFAARWLRARATGFDLNPEHVDAVGPALARAGIVLATGDALQVDLSGATHLLVNWYAFSAATRRSLAERFRRLPPGTRIVAVSFGLDASTFPCRDKVWALFSWGPERVWIHEVAAAQITSTTTPSNGR